MGTCCVARSVANKKCSLLLLLAAWAPCTHGLGATWPQLYSGQVRRARICARVEGA